MDQGYCSAGDHSRGERRIAFLPAKLPLGGRVSPGGRVVGLDANPAHTAMAAAFVSGHRLKGVQIVTADAGRTGLRSRSFDLVHTRTLLVNVPEPAVVVAEMVRLAKPGGRVVAADPDTEHALCYPARMTAPHCRGPGEVQEWRKMGSWVLRLVIPQQIGRGSGWHCRAAGSGLSSPCRALGA